MWGHLQAPPYLRAPKLRARNSAPCRRPSWSMPWPTPPAILPTGTSTSTRAWNNACTGSRWSWSPWTGDAGGRLRRIGPVRRPRASIRNSRRWPRARRRGAGRRGGRHGRIRPAQGLRWQVVTLQFGVNALSVRGRLISADPALVAECQRKPFAPDRALAAGPRRMRRHEGGIREQVLPGAADVDQVVASAPWPRCRKTTAGAPRRSAAPGAAHRVQSFFFLFVGFFRGRLYGFVVR